MAANKTPKAKGIAQKAVKGTTTTTAGRAIRKQADPAPSVEIGDEVNVYNYNGHKKLAGKVLLVYEDLRIDVLIMIPGREHQSEGHVDHISKAAVPEALFWDN